jgi:hypothetical protein
MTHMSVARSVEISVPPPSGVAAIDTASVKAALQAAGEAKGTAVLRPGTYKISEELVRPAKASILGYPNTILQGAPGATGECLLTDPVGEKTEYQSIVGGFTLDANNVFAHALWCRWFNHLVLGVKPKNSLEDDWIIGDLAAATVSAEPVIKPDSLVQRTAGVVAPGHYCLWAQNASDGRLPGLVVTGQETGIRIDKGGWRGGVGVHPVGAAFPMQVGIEDNGATEWFGSNLDTPTPKEHAGAAGTEAASVITDSEILSQHKTRPVTGANIPAESFVGTVTPGVSFILVNAKGEEVKPTGVVAGITLLGVGLIVRENGTQDFGGQVFNPASHGVDQGCVGVAVASNVTQVNLLGFIANGASPSFRVAQAFVGNISGLAWSGLIQKNCVKLQAASQVAAKSLSAEALVDESIKALQLGTGSVTAAKLGAASVEVGKVKPGSTPVGSGEENKVVLGESGVGRKRIAAITGNGSAVKFKVKHALETQAIIATVLNESFEEPVTPLAKVVAISLSEVEVTFTIAPGAKAIFYVVVVG